MRWKQFGAQLNAARVRGGLTQELLAVRVSEQLGACISQQSVAQWCRGQYRPIDRKTLLALCKVLYEVRGLTSLDEINVLLQAADQGAVYWREAEAWFPLLGTMTQVGTAAPKLSRRSTIIPGAASEPLFPTCQATSASHVGGNPGQAMGRRSSQHERPHQVEPASRQTQGEPVRTACRADDVAHTLAQGRLPGGLSYPYQDQWYVELGQPKTVMAVLLGLLLGLFVRSCPVIARRSLTDEQRKGRNDFALEIKILVSPLTQ